MGRFTIFSLRGCSDCKRTKAAFKEYGIPFVEINLSKYPDRRNDMLSLSDRLTVPQVFMNETHLGGAEETVKLLRKWAKDANRSPLERYQKVVMAAPDPKDLRFHPSTGPPTIKESAPPPRDRRNVIKVPNKDNTVKKKRKMSVLEMTELLKKTLPCRELKYNLTVYKNAFKANELIDALEELFFSSKTSSTSSREEALTFGRDILQERYGIVDHVVEDHVLKDTPSLFFRLTCHQTPNVLNSYRKWTERVDPDPMRLLKTLNTALMTILSEHTNDKTGKVDYKAAYQNPEFLAFEEATCELQGVDLGQMKPDLKLAFCINLYNMMIKYAFCRVGIFTSDNARHSFFSNVSFRIGPHVFSFQDLESGILRGNRKPPFSLTAPFNAAKDVRAAFMFKEVDCRIHFALNCGGASCPPVKDFTAESIQEELRIVALAFCEENVTFVGHQGDGRYKEILLPKIFSWYQEDFGSNHSALLRTIYNFSRGKRQVVLQSMLGSGHAPKVKFEPYDWSTDASDFVSYSGGKVKANSSRFL
eukprot:CAMPEP_0117034964 /NCGR_PEP_ID=MMETSP0472-20121206/24862_1 /TAXON_ID=693140 ORGANISM="Tiarina fusus, Strain LIS" /NCGR_SAMPLE_ID=MMETSP0472 /ASSEMBLY_ACC=CAM_ASM_000603 /LENGTH=531 /DNA_ID=CAMNT_0004744295 /DNA_START=318 /DNA_END=1913 /DNA_ORIENTATION=+